MDVTPNTSTFMIAGYIVIFGIMLTYLVSLISRFRGLNRNLQMLEEIGKEEEQ